MKRLAFVGGVLVVALFAAVAARASIDEPDPVVIVHWANSHPMREGLLPEMAEEFNKEDHETADGQPIKVVVISCDSSDQAADLAERVGGPTAEAQCHGGSDGPAPDPTIVTPQSDDWLVDINNDAPDDVIDLDATEGIAETWLGIVTYRAMAECLGWPGRQIGYAEMIQVLEDGWVAHPGCRPGPDWGDPPKLAFTNPNTSTSGRNVLVSLFTMFADKTSPKDLTLEDIQDDAVLGEVRSFQGLVDHYMPASILVNTKIAQGPRYGAFFLMPEDNLANLVMGNEEEIGPDGTEQEAERPVDDLVMIYPKEGAVLNSNPAAVVGASWVSEGEAEAADRWIEYLLEDDQQRAFMDMGFRPAEGSKLTVDKDKFRDWGLDAATPQATIDPGQLEPSVLEGILDSWGTVKKPAIVTFVIDLSGSMKDLSGSSEERLIDQVTDGMFALLEAMAGPDSAGQDSRVGIVTFRGVGAAGDDPEIKVLVEPGPLDLPALGAHVEQMREDEATGGGTPLYEAVKKAAEITSTAPGDADATRAVVVLSDGEDTLGRACLDELVTMESTGEADVTYCAKRDPGQLELTDFPRGADGERVDVADVSGAESKLPGGVQVFFIGFGSADIDVGRILAGATDAEYIRTEEDLAAVIEELSGYF